MLAPCSAVAAGEPRSKSVLFGGDLKLELGYGTGEKAGFRANLELGAHVVIPWTRPKPRRCEAENEPQRASCAYGPGERTDGVMIGLSGALGLRDTFPVDLSLGVGVVRMLPTAMVGATAGPTMRVQPELGGGFDVRLFLRFLVIDQGIKLSTIFVPGAPAEVQILYQMGIGLTL